MSVSKLETVRAQWMTALETIQEGGTYRNTVKKVYQEFPEAIGAYPSLVLSFGVGEVICGDSAWSIYNVRIPFFITCEISAKTTTGSTSNLVAAQDSLLHDILILIATLNTEHINVDPSWFVDNEPPLKFTPIFPSGDNTGEFTVWGTLTVRNMDGGFA